MRETLDVRVLYFAAARARTSIDEERLPLAGLTTAAAVDVLVKRHPALLAIVRSCRVAINHEFVSPDAVVPVGAEFVLIPPVAGG